jgi:acetylornithine deacetylase/succinyl-diaminopimelate desuccinylase-like protein
MARVGRMLKTLDRARLPIHITPAVRLVIEGLTANLGFPKNWLLKGLLHPYWADRILGWLGEKSRVFEPMLRHTVNATVIRGGQATNVIPSRVELELDGRLLPGFAPYDLLRELKDIIGPEIDLEVVAYEPGPGEPDMGLFETLAGVMNDLDPDGRPVPLLMTGVSDARFFAQLGIQTYGFLPMNLPDDFRFIETIHAADERVPAEAVAFGAEALYRLLVRYGSEPGFSLPNTP